MIRIEVPVAHEVSERPFTFVFYGYGDPTKVRRQGDKYYGSWQDQYWEDDATAKVWYINSNGYAQELNSKRPPSSQPSPTRVLLIPTFDTTTLTLEKS